MKTPFPALFALLTALPTASMAADILTERNIGMDLAVEIATNTVRICREQGYQTSAVVVDRYGLVRAALRDDLAARFTLQIAEEKANMVVMSGVSSGEFRKSREDIRPELNHINGIIVMEGGLPILAAGSRIGAIGVSGAPGGQLDAACAAKAMEALTERLEFAE
ncbi:MAG: heme-binding protein [Thiohalomonadaceae bacterium]